MSTDQEGTVFLFHTDFSAKTCHVMVCQVFPFTNGLGWSMCFGGQESPGSNTDICKIWMQYLSLSSPLNKKKMHICHSLSFILYSSSLRRHEFVLFDLFTSVNSLRNSPNAQSLLPKEGGTSSQPSVSAYSSFSCLPL